MGHNSMTRGPQWRLRTRSNVRPANLRDYFQRRTDGWKWTHSVDALMPRVAGCCLRQGWVCTEKEEKVVHNIISIDFDSIFEG